MNKLRLVLFPFSFIYAIITTVRNSYYKYIYKRYESPIKSIVIGNLSVGGTGKTPFTEYLIHALKDKNIAVLSRGYGRSTTGYLKVDQAKTANEVGDEPLQMARKFPSFSFHVCEDRTTGLKEILSKESQTDLILLDDAYQHLKIKAGFYIMLSTYQQPFFNDVILPAGNLRELRAGANRADVIIINKCPKDISEEDKEAYRKKISKYSNAPVYFSSIGYNTDAISANENYILLTGIANPLPLIDFLSQNHIHIIEHLKFNDHHQFNPSDLKLIRNLQEQHNCKIITTEKDMVRLIDEPRIIPHLIPIPIKIELNLSDQNQLMSQIRNFMI